jgi:adenylate kinase
MYEFELVSNGHRRDPATARILVVGPPGAGKGTQCAILSRYLGVPHVSTGELLREAVEGGTPLGRAANRFVARGLLVPDRLLLRVVHDRIGGLAAADDRVGGFLLDGMPRTIQQAEALDALVASKPIDAVIHLQVPDQVVLARLRARGREDDGDTAVLRRLSAYGKFTVPMLGWLARRRPVLAIDATRSIHDVTSEVVGQLRDRGIVAERAFA